MNDNNVSYCVLCNRTFWIASRCQLTIAIILRPITQSLQKKLLCKCRCYELFESQKSLQLFKLGIKIPEDHFKNFDSQVNIDSCNPQKQKALRGPQ